MTKPVNLRLYFTSSCQGIAIVDLDNGRVAEFDINKATDEGVPHQNDEFWAQLLVMRKKE